MCYDALRSALDGKLIVHRPTGLLSAFHYQVTDGAQSETWFKISISQDLKKLRRFYADRVGLDPDMIRYVLSSLDYRGPFSSRSVGCLTKGLSSRMGTLSSHWRWGRKGSSWQKKFVLSCKCQSLGKDKYIHVPLTEISSSWPWDAGIVL